jgi:hypothetical protein
MGGELLLPNVEKDGNVKGLLGVLLFGIDTPDDDPELNPEDIFEGVLPTGLELDDDISLRNL